jgi:hypothetical protein
VIVVLLTQPFRTRWEMAAGLIFLPIWASHALLDPWHGWWARYWLALAQVLLAGGGAVSMWRAGISSWRGALPCGQGHWLKVAPA